VSTETLWTFHDQTLAAIELGGFRVKARDGEIGTVVRTTGGSAGGYLVVDPGVAMPLGRQLLVPAGLVDAVAVEERQVSLRADRDQIKNAPEHDSSRQLDRASRSSFVTYYSGLAQPETGRSAPSGAVAGSRLRPSRATGPNAAAEPTKADLYARAKQLGIEGRSKMSKAELADAVGHHSGSARVGRSEPTANPVEVQSFLEGVGYPARARELVREAESQGAGRNVRATLRRLPEQEFHSPTEVSEAIGELD
jgi:Protein of unknown function (DUF2795)